MGAAHFFRDLSIVLFLIAAVSIVSHVLQLESNARRFRFLSGVVLGFVLFAADVAAMTFAELKLSGVLGSAIYLVHALLGVSTLGIFLMARVFVRADPVDSDDHQFYAK